MCRFAFGFDNGGILASDMAYMMTFFYQAIPWSNIFRYWNYLTFLPSVKKLKASEAHIRANISTIVNARKDKGVEDHEIDLMAELLRSGEKIGEDTIIDNCFQMITAGDTTPSAVTSFLYLLAAHPQVQEKLYQEIWSVIGDQEVSRDELAKCTYLHMVTKEVLRWSPPVRAPVPRRNLNEEVFSGVKIPPGSELCYCCYAVHHNEAVWSEPDKFDPERWSDENKGERHTMGWFPFLAGNRNCIGQAVALLELKSITAELLRRFTITIPKDYQLTYTASWISCPDKLDFYFARRPEWTLD